MEERYMLFEEMMQKEREEGRIEGRIEGHLEGLREGEISGQQSAILAILEMNFSVTPALTEKITNEKDSETLKRWLCLAAVSSTIEEFEEKI